MKNTKLYHAFMVGIPVITILAWVLITLNVIVSMQDVVYDEHSKITRRFLNSLSAQVSKDIQYGDYFQVRKTLGDFYDSDSMYSVQLILSNGKLIAQYPQGVDSDAAIERDKRDRKEYVEKIVDGQGGVIGTIYLGSNTRAVRKVINEQVLMFVGVGLLILLFEIVVIALFIKRYIKPLTQFAEEVKVLNPSHYEGLKAYINKCKSDTYVCSEMESFINAYCKSIETILRSHEENQSMKIMAAIGQMSSHIAHDMRSPLSVLKAYVGMQLEPEDENQKEYSTSAKRSVNKLLRMADDLVDYAKAKKIQRESVLLKKMYESGVRSEIISKVADKGAKLDIAIPADLCAEIDGYRVARVISNVVLNSIHAVDEGVGHIKIFAEKFDTRDLVIRVMDNGKGIDDDSLPHIFENFFSTDRKKGTGLGLSYCKQVVEAHGGTIDVESEVGKGTSFTIRIPDCVVSETDSRAYRNQPELKIDGRKFILIDDDADIRMRWRRIVEDGGGQVVGEADSPEKATSDGFDCAADVAIVDYSFDGSDQTGVDVISYLKKMGMKEIHMCTGYADDDAVRKAAFAAGADSVIQKDLG